MISLNIVVGLFPPFSAYHSLHAGRAAIGSGGVGPRTSRFEVGQLYGGHLGWSWRVQPWWLRLIDVY